MAVCVALFAGLTVLLCLNIDVLGVLEARNYAAYTVVGGWSLTADQLQVGITRLLYPFFCGLLLSRTRALLRINNGFAWCSLAIVVLLGMPWMGVGEARWPNGVYEAICILLLFPLIVSVGAGSSIKSNRASALNRWLGDISYPLYITHYPLIYMQMAWAKHHAQLPLSTHIAVAVSTFVMALLVAHAAFRMYDLPIRSWLQRKLFSA